jgi:hypothetical protein
VALADTLRQRFGLELRDFSGATVNAEVPVSADLVNRRIAERIRDHPQVAQLQVEPRPEDALAIEIVPRARLVPLLRINARILQQPQFPDDPTLVLQWSMPAAGPLAMLAAPALSYLKKLPPGIRMDGDRVAIDLRTLLESRGQAEVLAFVRRGAIHTRPGGFLLSLEVVV